MHDRFLVTLGIGFMNSLTLSFIQYLVCFGPYLIPRREQYSKPLRAHWLNQNISFFFLNTWTISIVSMEKDKSNFLTIQNYQTFPPNHLIHHMLLASLCFKPYSHCPNPFLVNPNISSKEH